MHAGKQQIRPLESEEKGVFSPPDPEGIPVLVDDDPLGADGHRARLAAAQAVLAKEDSVGATAARHAHQDKERSEWRQAGRHFSPLLLTGTPLSC